jgi:UDP-3-O-[3-hydroxymyristoyl] N-acetylglucosamine deacetylase
VIGTMTGGRQTTLRRSAELSGIGVHSGSLINVSIHPAEAGTGFVFVRQQNGLEREVCASHQAVAATEFATVLGDGQGPMVSTIEHVLAALYGLRVDNAVIEIDGPEIPIMDGSAAPFVAAIEAAGVVNLQAPRRYLRVLKPVGVMAGESYGELRPYDSGLRLEIEIEFEHALIGRQALAFDLDPANFRRQVSRARTFGFMHDVQRLWDAGYAFGASLENTLVLGEDRVLNPEGARYPDEFVRHKALDAIGDLALAGVPILGAYRSFRGGHRLNHAVLCALLADRSAWMLVEAVEREDVRQRAPARVFGERGLIAQPAFAPDVS